jgi:uncharacterized membrane protein YoaK (UPF0700 family)
MKSLTRSNIVASLLAFNGGFVDMAGFLGLNGLFTAHITGNFVPLGHALVEGSHGIMGKILALPQFIAAAGGHCAAYPLNQRRTHHRGLCHRWRRCRDRGRLRRMSVDGAIPTAV